MRKNTDFMLFVLTCIILTLMVTVTVLLAYECRVSGFDLSAHPWIAVLLGGVPVLLLLCCRKRDRGGSIVFADLDANGIPEDIFEVPEQTLLRFCRDEFHMHYRIEYSVVSTLNFLQDRDTCAKLPCDGGAERCGHRAAPLSRGRMRKCPAALRLHSGGPDFAAAEDAR